VTPVAHAIVNSLLRHHAAVCRAHTARPPIIDRCVITYGDLCQDAGYPQVTQSVGRYLQEVAVYCQQQGWPPLNSLAVNQDSRIPGDNYDVAPGCSLIDWPSQAERCIEFDGYPEMV